MQNSIQILPAQGNERHALTTHDPEFAYSLYEKALDLGIEPDLAATGGGYLIEMVCAEEDFDAALTLAFAGEVLV